MNVHPYLDALHDSWLGHIMRDVPWLFPTCEGLHFVGMSLLLGTIGVIDLRVLGFFKGLPIGPLHRMLPLAFFGFALNVATGVAFVCSDPDSYWIVGAFRLKMVLIMLAGLNALWFWLVVLKHVDEWGPDADASRLAKVISAISLLFWVGVVTAGRFIAFSGTGTL
jgi:hypothetical protein